MGKKKIIKQTTEDVLQEKEALEAKTESVLRRSSETKGHGSRGAFSRGIAHVHASYNNTIITVTDAGGDALAWASSGTLGFRGPKKATPYAATRVAEAIAARLERLGVRDLDVRVRGIGAGRDAAIRGLASAGFNVLSVKDVTPIPHGGTRAPRPRRV